MRWCGLDSHAPVSRIVANLMSYDHAAYMRNKRAEHLADLIMAFAAIATGGFAYVHWFV